MSDKPAWVRALPQLSGRRPLLALERERESEALLSVDDAVRRLMAEIAARGDLGRTVVFFLTDNGYSFGAHRWVGKQCPYEECIRTPFAVRVPWAASGTRPNVISTVDLAPTIASFAGTAPDLAVDGSDVRPLIDPHAGETSRALPKGALIEYLGGELVPNWVGVRTRDFTYVEYADGERELYDLTGRAGPADPGELENRVSDPAYQTVRNRLALLLRTLRGR